MGPRRRARERIGAGQVALRPLRARADARAALAGRGNRCVRSRHEPRADLSFCKAGTARHRHGVAQARHDSRAGASGWSGRSRTRISPSFRASSASRSSIAASAIHSAPRVPPRPMSSSTPGACRACGKRPSPPRSWAGAHMRSGCRRWRCGRAADRATRSSCARWDSTPSCVPGCPRRKSSA